MSSLVRSKFFGYNEFLYRNKRVNGGALYNCYSLVNGKKSSDFRIDWDLAHEIHTHLLGFLKNK